MRELADFGGVFVLEHRRARRSFAVERKRRERHRTRGHKRHAIVLPLGVVMPTKPPGRIAVAVHKAWAECGHALRRVLREFDISPESAVVLVVIFLDDDRAIGQLRFKVEPVGGSAGIVRADQRVPARAVGLDRPNSPRNAAADALRLERAEHDPPIGERHRMQRPARFKWPIFSMLPGINSSGSMLSSASSITNNCKAIAG